MKSSSGVLYISWRNKTWAPPPVSSEEEVTEGQLRTWRRRKSGSDIIDSHCLETDWNRISDFGGKQTKICIKRSSLLAIKIADGDGEEESSWRRGFLRVRFGSSTEFEFDGGGSREEGQKDSSLASRVWEIMVPLVIDFDDNEDVWDDASPGNILKGFWAGLGNSVHGYNY